MAEFVKIGAVRAFPDVKPDKAQALKPLEESAEVFGAWQVVESYDADSLAEIYTPELAELLEEGL